MKNITIGILAGMGPRSTSPFLENVLDQCQIQYGAKYDIDYPHIITYSLPTPFYVDRVMDEDALKTAIKDGLDRLEAMKADVIAIPCNSAHGHFEFITRDSKIPVLNIIEETLKGIRAGSVITLFATEMTRKTELYQEGVLKLNCDYVFEESWQVLINQVILRIKNKEDMSETLEIWNKLIESAKMKNVDTIVLACTDLNVIVPQGSKDVLFIDSSEALAKSLVIKYIEMTNTK